ncbi:alpha/beta fold hydrolase [Pseudomonas palleroniana]|uniref:alpha/beta fold hydrolase n=1 Tax=Pseudomonas palleroniana TaxID=191390 RepID=UPI001FD0FE61|nr:alpha/beta hydrolase [Pseudomonas palleroniana]UOP10235.1 alpha/beta hydrolase [Pseudomonas palleroniana]
MNTTERTNTVLVLHGWGGSFASTFGGTGLVEKLEAKGYSILKIDLPGHGPDGGSHHGADYADLASIIESQLPASPLLAVGFSLGAKLVLELSVRQPTRFQRIVLGGLGDNIFAAEKMGNEVAAALEAGVDEKTHPAVAGLVEYSKASLSDPLSIAAVLRRPPNPVFTKEKLRAVACPVYVMNGWDDGVARPENELLLALPTASLSIIPEINHLNLTGNKFFIDSAVSFLTETP